MKIKINSEEELIKVATEAIHILSNLRKFQKLWENNYGVELKHRKKYYEEQADILLKKLQIPEHRTSSQIKIEINDQSFL